MQTSGTGQGKGHTGADNAFGKGAIEAARDIRAGDRESDDMGQWGMGGESAGNCDKRFKTEMTWETLDMRARVPGGCYYISLAHDPAGIAYIARFCADPRSDSENRYSYGVSDWSYNRFRGIGHDEDIEKVKALCEADLRKQCI